MVMKYLQMETSTEESISLVVSMVEASITGQMVLIMMETFFKVIEKDKENGNQLE